MIDDTPAPAHIEKLARQLHWSAGTAQRGRDPDYAPRPWHGAGYSRRTRCRKLARLMIEALLKD